MSEKAEALRRAVAAHSDDRALELATNLGLSVQEYAAAKTLQIQIQHSPEWDGCRSPHGLMVDTLYLVAKRNGHKVSAVRIRNLTLEVFGVGTQPRPSAWQDRFAPMIEAFL